MRNEMFDAMENGQSDFLPPIDFRFDSNAELTKAYQMLSGIPRDGMVGLGALDLESDNETAYVAKSLHPSTGSMAGLEDEAPPDFHFKSSESDVSTPSSEEGAFTKAKEKRSFRKGMTALLFGQAVQLIQVTETPKGQLDIKCRPCDDPDREIRVAAWPGNLLTA